MLNKRLGWMLLLIMILSPCIALGQDTPGGKWWRNPKVSKQLSLTEEEKTRLDKQYVKSRRKLIDLKRKVEREQFELENLIENESMDDDAVKGQFKKLEKARTNLADERFNFLINTRKILGNERFQDVKRIYQNERKQRSNRKKGR